MYSMHLQKLTTAIKVQGVSGWSHSFQNRYSPHLRSEMAFSRRDWTAALCWYPVSQDLQQTLSGTWLQSRIIFPSRLIRMWQVFSKLPVHARNLKPKDNSTVPVLSVCWACSPPHLSSCRRTHPGGFICPVLEMWKPLHILGKSRRLSAASPHPGSRKLQKMGVHYRVLQLLPAGLVLFFVHLAFFFNIYKMGAGISASLEKIRFIRAFLPCLRFYSPPFWKDSYRCHYSLSTKESHGFTGVSCSITLGRSGSGPCSRPGCNKLCGSLCFA